MFKARFKYYQFKKLMLISENFVTIQSQWFFTRVIAKKHVIVKWLAFVLFL
jgi:hypothetical protein